MADSVRQHAADRVIIRLDAGFNSGVVFTRLEAEGHHYLMRLRKNKVLEALATPYVEDCSYETKTYFELEYGAQSWGKPRRVILVVKPRSGELFNDCYFLVTNLDADTHSGTVTYRLSVRILLRPMRMLRFRRRMPCVFRSTCWSTSFFTSVDATCIVRLHRRMRRYGRRTLQIPTRKRHTCTFASSDCMC